MALGSEPKVAAPLDFGLRYLLRPERRVPLGVLVDVGSLLLYQPVEPGPYPLGVPQQPANKFLDLALYTLDSQVLPVGAVPARPGVVARAATVVVKQAARPRTGGVRSQGCPHTPQRRDAAGEFPEALCRLRGLAGVSLRLCLASRTISSGIPASGTGTNSHSSLGLGE